MNKLKPLLPSLKEKKRYLAFEIVSKSKIKSFSEAAKAIWASTLAFAGTKETARMGLMVLPETFNKDKQRGLIKIGHKNVEELKASLALINQIEQQPVIVRTIGVSGILAKAEKRYIAS
ncbi:MAG TPA: Rpp14/Pop5 family protein [Candidatus Nanoarchaeia archaeon]|nr:Rpp14/Pop5 family protein [Candidatus Nanoarchaeia archaeon]